MSLFMVDVEADGPAPGLFSMVSLGCVRVDRDMQTTFRADFAPLPGAEYIEAALAVSDVTRAQHLTFPDPAEGMKAFDTFIKANSKGRAVFISDNPAFDWQYVNYYFYRFLFESPFGHSARRVGDFTAGLERDFFASSKWKKKRVTKHTHDPVDDARGNVEALIAICDEHGVKLPLS